MSNRLIEILPYEWLKLCEIYCKHKKEASGDGFLKTIINWKSRDPKLNIKIFALDGLWQSDGTFVCIDYDLHNIQIYFNTLSDNLERAIEALNCLDFKKTVHRLCGVPARLIPAVDQYLTLKNFKNNQLKSILTVWYHIEEIKALQFDIGQPHDLRLSKLNESHAEFINQQWSHNAPRSVIFVKRLLSCNDSVGVFDETDKLVAWCLRLPLGSLGLLTVVDGYKRRGLGSLLVRYMSHLIASKKEMVMASVVKTNIESRALFQKLGFSEVDQVSWFTVGAPSEQHVK